MSFYPNERVEAIAVLYDLRDPRQWTAASEVRRTWGREWTVVHVLDNDHILVEFRPGGALGASA